MTLTFEVIPPHAAQLGAARLKVFRSGGIIGRDKSSDWILPHGKVSGRHARITCESGVFYIEDSSRNGTFLNSPANRLVPGRPHPLNTGDRLIIGPYEIQVSIEGEAAEGRWRSMQSGSAADIRSGPAALFESDDPFAQPDFSAPHVGFPPASPSKPLSPVEAGSGEELDPLVLLGEPASRAPSPKPRGIKPKESNSPLDAYYRPPAIVPPPAPREADAVIPSDYDFLAPDDLQNAPSPPPPLPVRPNFEAAAPTPPVEWQPPISPAVLPIAGAPGAIRPGLPVEAVPIPLAADVPAGERSSGDLAAVLAGAGLGGVAVTADLARNFGQILRVVVSGVMDVLRARQQIKDEFRMPVTRVRPVDNNPLKLSANVDDALHNLLVKRNAAFLGPVEAFDDAFDDLRDHQMALLAGMRTAFESMLAQFEPDRLQQGFDRQLKKSGFLTIPNKLRYWELYRERYEDVIKDPELSFRKLFGEEFARAYEEQLSRLKAEKIDRKET